MYKLFLCLRYLRSRVLAYLAMLGVALCVFMMLVSVSVMSGFLWKIEMAAKGLFGDIVIESSSLSGLSRYDELIDAMKTKVDRVEAASPFILTYGIVRVPGTDYRQTVQIAGICLPQRADVSDFEHGLFVQKDVSQPTFSPPMATVRERSVEDYDEVAAICRREEARALTASAAGTSWVEELRGALVGTMGILILLVGVGTTIWVGYDSWYNKIPTGGESYSSDTVSWVLFCMLLWVAAFPYYLFRRSKELRERQGTTARRSLVTALGLGLFALELLISVCLLILMFGQQEPAEAVARIRRTFDYRDRGLRRIDNTRSLAGDLAELRKALAAARNAPGEDTTKALAKGLALLRVTMEQSWGDLGRETSRAMRESKPLGEELKRAEGSQATDETADALAECIDLLESFCVDPPARRIILGLGIPGFSFRTYKGETIRHVMPGSKVSLTLMPLGKRLSMSDPTPNTEVFTIIDDCNSGVSSIDSKIVYVPFTTLQKLTNMGAEYDPDRPNEVAVLPRASQIHVKVKDGITDERQLREICGQIREVWAELEKTGPVMASTDVSVVTWRQLQAKVIQPIESQRTLVGMMFGIMWGVSGALIFVILYTIVVQKTRDIGVLKAIGASGGGVATIFLTYGAIIALLGSLVGTLAGWYFIHNINRVEDLLYKLFGFRVWDRETFMFEKIPNEVDVRAATVIVIVAIFTGLFGALLPAIRAAIMEPVEALRYE